MKIHNALPRPLIASFIIAAASVACGTANPPVTEPGPQGGAGPLTTSTPTAAPNAPAPTATETAPEPTTEPTTPPPSTAMAGPPIKASELVGELTKAGLDPEKLPPMASMTTKQKKGVMKYFKKSLGYSECTGCHVDGDFKAKTRNIQIARRMWDEFVVPLRTAESQPLFCDSCHQGKDKMLDRADGKAVKAFMKEHYTGHLVRADGAEHNCASCHGKDVEIEIFDKLWKIPAQ